MGTGRGMGFVILLILFSSQDLCSDYPELSYEQWQNIAPYLLPDTHPVKENLDRIFEYSNALGTRNTLIEAGFTLHEGGFSKTTIARHKDLNGVFIKLYLDDQPEINELYKLMKRIKGAERAKISIVQHHWEHLFKVPRKWLYILPENASYSAYPHKKFVLVAEDMHLLPKKKNYDLWRYQTSKSLLNKVYTILTEAGLSDSAYPFNMPYSKDGRIAFVDTEHYNVWPVVYDNLSKYLSSEMRSYWQELIENGLPTP